MRRTLALHPGSRRRAVNEIAVDVNRPRPDYLSLCYIISGAIKALRLPAVATPARTDELWRHTCFEAFVRPDSGTRYYEFNFSPSTQWAAYEFSGYRSGMRVAGEIAEPRIEVESQGESYALQASVDLSRLGCLPSDAAWRLGLSAIIEEADGNLSYWALAHPKGRADFHHSDCFALELPPA